MQRITFRMKNTAYAWLLPMLLIAWAMPVYAEQADRDKPIDLEADSVIVDDAKQISTYSGNVILSQGSLVIHADTLVVREDSSGFQHSTALGNPTGFKQKIEGKNEYMEGSAKRIEYDGRMDKVQLFGKASVKRGDNMIQGEYIATMPMQNTRKSWAAKKPWKVAQIAAACAPLSNLKTKRPRPLTPTLQSLCQPRLPIKQRPKTRA